MQVFAIFMDSSAIEKGSINSCTLAKNLHVKFMAKQIFIWAVITLNFVKLWLVYRTILLAPDKTESGRKFLEKF